MKQLFLVLLWAGLAVNSVPAQTNTLSEKDMPPLGGGWGFYQLPVTDPALPKVLLIGDSISIGYAPVVVNGLKGKANVSCLFTSYHVGTLPILEKEIAGALAHGLYAVIHFNDMGLHGLPPEQIPAGQYESKLRAYVDFLEKNAGGAILIWTTTTPISVKDHLDQPAPLNPLVGERNAIAARVMQERNIRTDDIYRLVADKPQLHRADGIHWLPEAQVLQGRQAAAVIGEALKKRPPGQ